MAIIQPPVIPSGPTSAPQRGNKTTFPSAFEAFLAWFLGNFALIVTAINSAYNNALEAFNSANTATSAAAAALATANATPWVSGTTYQQYANVISPVDGFTYRRLTAAGSGTTDPSADRTNWGYLQPKGFANMAIITASGTWVCPAGITKAEITVVDGGGGGSGGSGGSTGSSYLGATGGNAGISVLALTSGNSYTATVGAGGSGTTTGSFGSGGASSFAGADITTLTTANAAVKAPGGGSVALGTTGGWAGGGSLLAPANSTGYGAGGHGGTDNTAGTAGKAGVIIIKY